MDPIVGKIQRSEQQLPSVSSDTFVEPHSVLKSKIAEEERALATHGNKENLGEFGGETKNNLDKSSLLLCELYMYLLYIKTELFFHGFDYSIERQGKTYK